MGVRELRQNLSKYLDRIKRGERLEVTEHGRPVAVLVPLGAPRGAARSSDRRGQGDAAGDGPVVGRSRRRGRRSTALSDALEQQRADRL